MKDEPVHESPADRIDRLLSESRSRRYDEPAVMVKLAEEAVREAESLDPASYGEVFVADIRALAGAELGNAYRLTDQFARAGGAFDEAYLWWTRGTRDLRLMVRLTECLAALYCHQRNFPAALYLLERAFRIWQMWGDSHAAGRARVTAGLYAWYSGSPREALLLLCEGIELIDIRREPQLTLAASHNLLCALTDMGWFEQAERYLARFKPLYQEETGRLNTLRFQWLEAVIAGGLGRLEGAERGLRKVRRGFLRSGLTFAAAMVSLDLSLLWIRMGHFHKIERLTKELIGVFRGLGVARETIATLVLLQRACRARAEDRVQRHLREAIGLVRLAACHYPGQRSFF